MAPHKPTAASVAPQPAEQEPIRLLLEESQRQEEAAVEQFLNDRDFALSQQREVQLNRLAKALPPGDAAVFLQVPAAGGTPPPSPRPTEDRLKAAKAAEALILQEIFQQLATDRYYGEMLCVLEDRTLKVLGKQSRIAQRFMMLLQVEKISSPGSEQAAANNGKMALLRQSDPYQRAEAQALHQLVAENHPLFNNPGQNAEPGF